MDNGTCVEWRTSTHCDSGSCVQVGRDLGTLVHVRDSKDPGGPVLTFVVQEWGAFVSGVKAGEFDL